MNKYKCKCGYEWFSSELEYETCPMSDDVYNGQHNHITRRVKVLSAEDYAWLWRMDLEDANRHSLTDMPNAILNALNKNVKDKKAIRKVMMALYKEGIGID